ncbi:MAG TPA: hydantoinase/oxoprolinase family protein [Steroidobacteraceae bacterium]|jgi:N-methylhydantoinase A/oxoprolinase/acetone carboxylase beta subunit|nr:hydantoinase/oxoprolinase family protein [Steroidobacteraceae bacterium]
MTDDSRTGTRIPSPDLWIGLDTGGTYTDAIALDGERRVVASAKALTTHWDLSIGLAGAVRAVLAKLPEGARREHISLVSVSTTLATNAVVENRFSPICTILIGFDDRMVERSELNRLGAGVIVRARGGHDATGQESEPLDESAVDAAVREFDSEVEAFAVAAAFSVRNPARERRVRERIRRVSSKPVTCSHELSSRLDAPKRALTAAMNARLTPQIRHLLDALGQVLEREAISAPLMIVKGDGTLMKAEIALEYPVETVLSGPAASVVGAGYLSGLKEFAVADMGGTTTDVAIVIDGRPVIRPEGAVIAGWRTMVEAIDVRTCGLGGDSEVYFDRHGRLMVGPRKAMPLSLLADQFPDVLVELRQLAGAERLPPFAAQFAFRNPGREPGAQLVPLEQRVWDALTPVPRRLGEVARSTQGVEAARRLVDRGLASLAGFTPSDAMHVLGRQHGWSVEAARLGAAILATEERNASARKQSDTPEGLCKRTYQHVVREAARVLLESALARDPGIEAKHARWGPLGVLIEDMVAGRPFSQLLDAQIRLATPLIAIGAPVGAYYPEVARRLGAQLLVPEHAAVCNAVGAVAGVVSETCEVLVNQPTFNVFRVHDPAGNRDYPEEHAAIEDATRVSRQLALAAARRAGASDPHVETCVEERRAQGESAGDYLAEATVRSRATGRPATGRAP